MRTLNFEQVNPSCRSTSKITHVFPPPNAHFVTPQWSNVRLANLDTVFMALARRSQIWLVCGATRIQYEWRPYHVDRGSGFEPIMAGHGSATKRGDGPPITTVTGSGSHMGGAGAPARPISIGVRRVVTSRSTQERRLGTAVPLGGPYPARVGIGGSGAKRRALILHRLGRLYYQSAFGYIRVGRPEQIRHFQQGQRYAHSVIGSHLDFWAPPDGGTTGACASCQIFRSAT